MTDVAWTRVVWALFLLLMVLMAIGMVACSHEAPPLPPVPDAPGDLSTWSVPELVQPPAPAAPVAEVPKEKPSSAELVLDYTPAATYALNVPVNAPLDIVLERGEQLRNLIGGDQTPVAGTAGAESTAKSPWDLKEGAHGTGDTLRSHLFLTVTKPGLSAGFVVTTTLRTYYLQCKSVAKSPVRTVRWRAPLEPLVVKPKEPGLLPDPTEPKRYHVGYEITSLQKQPPEWTPKVWDDGRKMFLLMPEVTLFEVAPMVRMVSVNGPALVNSRQYLNVVLVDQLAPRLELRVGLGETAEVVTITRGALRTIQCPEAPECPVWPAAAQVLARRGTPPVSTPAPAPPVPQKHADVTPPAPPQEGETP